MRTNATLLVLLLILGAASACADDELHTKMVEECSITFATPGLCAIDEEAARHAFDYGASRNVSVLNRQCILDVPCVRDDEGRLSGFDEISACLDDGNAQPEDNPECFSACDNALEACGGDCSWLSVEACLNDHEACAAAC